MFERVRGILPGVSVDSSDTQSGKMVFLLMSLIGIGGLVSLVLMEIGILSIEGWIWMPLGSVFALMFVHPIVKLPSVFEAMNILVMYITFIGYIIVQHPTNLGNVLTITVVLLLVVIVFEYPGRFSLE